MLTQICQYIRNWFETDKIFGRFKIESGVLTYEDGTPLPLLDNQYYRIIGSVFNDGVHKYTFQPPNPAVLSDEVFEGAVWAMAVPKDVLDIASEIADWQTKYGGAESAVNSPYSSESFAGYSYSKSAGSATESATDPSAGDWRSVYGSRLNLWRKI